MQFYVLFEGQCLNGDEGLAPHLFWLRHRDTMWLANHTPKPQLGPSDTMQVLTKELFYTFSN